MATVKTSTTPRIRHYKEGVLIKCQSFKRGDTITTKTDDKKFPVTCESCIKLIAAGPKTVHPDTHDIVEVRDPNGVPVVSAVYKKVSDAEVEEVYQRMQQFASVDPEFVSDAKALIRECLEHNRKPV